MKNYRSVGGIFLAPNRRGSLPHGVKAEKITARCEHAVLELVVPLPVELAGKKIPIQIEAGKIIEPKAA